MDNRFQEFRNQYKIPEITTNLMGEFSPNKTARDIYLQQLVEFSELVKDTPNKDLIAFKDPMVQDLVDYIMAAIVIENERINDSDVFPIQIYRRYKSNDSMAKKIEEWSGREEKKGAQVTDYLGFRVVPEAEHSVFYGDSDPVLQEMIDRRESMRLYLAERYKELSTSPEMTFNDYRLKCKEVLSKLKTVFPKEATTRIEYYDKLAETIDEDYNTYTTMLDDADEKLTLQDISELTHVNIKSLLTELTSQYPNEVMLYKLHKDLINTFENSELLRALGITMSNDPNRTKHKSTPNGYRSEFIGLDLSIKLKDGRIITLPIECQVQTQEQYRDGKAGFASHSKLEGKKVLLKSLPKKGDGKAYTDANGALEEYRQFLHHIMNISPSFAIAKKTGDDFENERVNVTPYDLYEAFRLVSSVPKDNSTYFRIYSKYLNDLYERRDELLPSGTELLPKYIRYEDIPNPNSDYKAFSSFFATLRESLGGTLDYEREIKENDGDSKKEDTVRDI